MVILQKHPPITSWQTLLEEEMYFAEDSGPVVHCTLSDEEMKEEFDFGFGTSKGKPFTAWTEDRVYFPAVYDGAEWVNSAPRNPCDESTNHVGGQ